MPELPDIEVYVAAIAARTVGRAIVGVRIANPFVVRSVDPPVDAAVGRTVCKVRRLGKRVVLDLGDEHFLIFHLMIAGRFRWMAAGGAIPRRLGLAALDFENGSLLLTEAGTKKRASIHFLGSAADLAGHDSGGLEVLEADLAGFRERLLRGSHTLKRALTNPRLFSGIGNAYSDEILHTAGLSPIKLTTRLSNDEIGRLFDAARLTLLRWIHELFQKFGITLPARLAELRHTAEQLEVGNKKRPVTPVQSVGRFPGPGDITAFREAFAVHGRFGQPCPVCGAKVQRIRYADNETNYCPRCQTGGRILKDRSLSRLLKNDWPRTIEELEE